MNDSSADNEAQEIQIPDHLKMLRILVPTDGEVDAVGHALVKAGFLWPEAWEGPDHNGKYSKTGMKIGILYTNKNRNSIEYNSTGYDADGENEYDQLYRTLTSSEFLALCRNPQHLILRSPAAVQALSDLLAVTTQQDGRKPSRTPSP